MWCTERLDQRDGGGGSTGLDKSYDKTTYDSYIVLLEFCFFKQNIIRTRR